MDEPRRPWLELDSLKAKFLERSSKTHPDRAHGGSDPEKQIAHDRYAQLNAAYNCLREPKSRLQHLLELELGHKPKEVQQLDAATAELFIEAGQLCREVDGFLAERATATSPLVKVEMFERAQEWIDRLNAVQKQVNARQQKLAEELKRMNKIWETAPPGGPARLSALPLRQLEAVWRDLSYLTRWTQQIQERVAQLSF